MTKTDGEYELVLGNRQLLSAFFIIVILFGVFFTMGYVVGRNSAPASAASSAPATVASNAKPDSGSSANAQPAQQPAPPPEREAKGPAETKAVETKPVSPPEITEAPRPARPAAASPAKRGGAAGGGSNAPAGAVAVTPAPGRMYLQVMAVGQPQAGAVVDTLKQKGFPALLTPGPNAAMFRVLVGPYPDTSALGKAKADLENAGFRPIVRK
jgi:septal ring-binding cell division protein DamX